MKKFILASLMLFISFGAAFAEGTQLSPDAEKKCSDVTRTMANELRLNEMGYIKLKALNRELYAATEEILLTSKSEEQQEKLQALAAKYETELVSFLSPSQLQAYKSYAARVSSSSKFVAIVTQ
ncbi:hypothetical protein [Pontibacter liquoris]|uniref:hypothetical protein n=1 Tax=Pontibacter liquoris TaxID=2905677 RepID=UPI001FA6CC13|nr:hypothetical protein [Pontibacter liquoris]